MEFTLEQLAALLGGSVEGNPQEKIHMLGKIQDAQKGQIAFLSNPKYEQYIYTTHASAVIVARDFKPRKTLTTSLIRVDNPYNSFTQLLEEYHKFILYQKVGVEEPSFIGENTKVGVDVYRGAFSYIGHRVTIGDNVKIYPHVYVGDGVTIGDNTILHPNVKIYGGNRIGSHCVIHAGTVIGSDGFGFAPQADGSYKTIPQLGQVILEDYVSIGANSVIDCATLMGDATVIRQGVKMDNLIQIAHNVEIGKNTVIAAQAGISGSTKVGENAMIGGQVGIAGHLVIASRTQIGAQSGIAKSVKEPGQQIMGSPAIQFKDFFRSYAVFKRLPDLYDRLRELEKHLGLVAEEAAVQNQSQP